MAVFLCGRINTAWLRRNRLSARDLLDLTVFTTLLSSSEELATRKGAAVRQEEEGTPGVCSIKQDGAGLASRSLEIPSDGKQSTASYVRP